MEAPTGLCSLCSLLPQHLDVRSFDEGIAYNRYPHYGSLPDLEKSATTGCSLCVLILHSMYLSDDNFTKHDRSEWGVVLVRNGVVPRDAPPHSITIDLVRYQGQWQRECKRVGWMPYEFPGEKNWEFNPVTGERTESTRRGITREVFSDRNVDMIQWWVGDCLASHQQCKEHSILVGSQDEAYLPGRVIDTASGEDAVVRLIDFKDAESKDYITLSHCWGRDPAAMLTTTEETYEQRRAGIPVSSLPPSFRDAIRLTRLLGYRYVWIDAICIIQGSPADFAVEGSKMGSIYGNSICCIVATAASSCVDGFSAQRNIEPCTLHWNTTEFERRVTPELGTSYAVTIFPRTGMQVNAGVRGPVDTRAWTLQERLLSPRILDFTKNEIYWQCRKYNSCESGDTYVTPPNAFDTLVDGSPSGREPYNIWYEWVRQVSQRNLTVDSDKLPSMGGLARVIAKRNGDEYAAGLWKKDMLFGLVSWKCDFEENLFDPEANYQGARGRSMSSRYRAPTWSWASVDGPLQMLDRREYPVLDETENAVIESIDVLNIGVDEMGQVDSGKIEITGRMIVVTAKHLYGNTYEMRISTRGTEIQEQGQYIGVCYFDLEEWDEYNEFYFMRIVTVGETAYSIDMGTDIQDKKVIKGMCLTPTYYGEDCDTLMRIGVGQVGAEFNRGPDQDSIELDWKGISTEYNVVLV